MRLSVCLMLALAGSGCDCHASVEGGPCATLTNDSLCGAACSVDESCGPRLYCGPQGRCTADCAGDIGCERGARCDHGRCAAAFDAGIPLADSGECAAVRVALQSEVPTVALLIDQSSSMENPFPGADSRWDAVRDALVDPERGIVTDLDRAVSFGATLYTSHDGDAGGQCPILIDVPPALGNFRQIWDLLDENDPDDDTPTGEAIEGLVASLEARPPEGPLAPVIVLATDGEPDTCAAPDPQTGQVLAIAAVENAFASGYRVYILGVSSEIGAAHLQDMANAGAGLEVGGRDREPYFTALQADELAMAFRAIIGEARPCTFTLSGEVDPALAPDGTVLLNEAELSYDDANGWHLRDETTLELQGEACETFRLEPDVVLEASFPCGAVIF